MVQITATQQFNVYPSFARALMSAVISEADLLPRKFISGGFVEIYQMGKQAKPLSF